MFICNDPGAWGVQNLAKEAIALNKPRAGVVIEKRGRSWHVPSYIWKWTFVGPYLSSMPTKEGSCCRTSSRIGYDPGSAALCALYLSFSYQVGGQTLDLQVSDLVP